MAEQFQTSFIPKKTFDVGPAPKPASSSASGVISFVAVILFVLSLVSAVGVFFYERILIASIAKKQATLEQAKSAFEPEFIRKLSRTDSKFTIGTQLLNNHTAPSGVLELLEETTLETVRFNDFSYLVDSEGVTITMRGVARTFASVALQSDEFAKNRAIRQPVFSGLTLDERGDVQFMVSAVIDPTVISYRERSARGGTAVLKVEETEPGTVAGVSTSI